MELNKGGRLLTFAVLAGVLGLFLPESRAQSNEHNERKDYASAVRETYNFRFGASNLSAPENAAVDGDDFLQSAAFLSAAYCARCHQESYSQWRQAVHSNSFRTPFYRTV